MPCDCPEDRLVPTGDHNYLVCANGSLANFYRLVEQAIPDIEMTHGRPTAHPDGSLDFPDTPPAIPGYRQDGFRLYPTWPPCKMRILRIQVVDKTLQITSLCGNPGTEQFGQVVIDQCQNCHARPSAC